MRAVDEESNQHIVPYVIEPALGVDRAFLVLLYDAYREEEVKNEKRVYLQLHPKVAPISVAWNSIWIPSVKSKNG